MRGIFNYVRGFFHNTATEGLGFASYMVRQDLQDFADAHFSASFGGSMPGIFIRVPFTRLSTFIEWREVNVGLGQEMTGPRDWSFYVGHIQGVVSLDRAVA